MILHPTESQEVLVSLANDPFDGRGIEGRDDGDVEVLFVLRSKGLFDVLIDVVGEEGGFYCGAVDCDVEGFGGVLGDLDVEEKWDPDQDDQGRDEVPIVDDFHSFDYEYSSVICFLLIELE